MTLLEGKSMTDVEKKWKSDFVPTLQTNWMVYVFSQSFVDHPYGTACGHCAHPSRDRLMRDQKLTP